MMDKLTCKVCKGVFNWDRPKNWAGSVPDHCGRLPCRAEATWTPEAWEGLARMADARKAAGRPITPMDVEAWRRRDRHVATPR